MQPEEDLSYLQRRIHQHHKRFRSRQPKRSKNVMAAVLVKKGYGNIQSSNNFDETWKKVAGELLTKNSRVSKIRNGVLEVIVANSILVQEMSFLKNELLIKLNEELPNQKIEDIRCKVGKIN